MKPNEAKQLEIWDRQNLWHPFTQMQEYEGTTPLIVERGEGSYLIDIHGKKYLDGVSSLWVNVHGHQKQEIDQAVRGQLDQVAHSTLLGLSNVPAIKLARQLLSIAPGNLTKVFYSDNGSTAVEIALKMAFQYWQQKEEGKYASKTRFIAFHEAYHGDTLGSVSVGGINLFHTIYRPLLFQSYKAHYPDKTQYPHCGSEALESISRMVEQHHGETAAVVIEPGVQGAAGMRMHPEGFLKAVRDLCNRHDLLLICDEVATGFGRTGKMFACEHEGVEPDFLCLAKGFTGGYLPLAATLVTEEIYGVFKAPCGELKTFFHGHTYTGNPLACAAALASLECFEKENVLERLQPKIARLAELLETLRTLPHVGDIRQSGFMVGIDLVKEKDRSIPYPLEEKMGTRVIAEARERGVILRPLGNVIVIMPPLSISLQELEELMEITRESIRAATES
jgi:adenosylmethionine-8-amino-7-oxononanoate aminotransferase